MKVLGLSPLDKDSTVTIVEDGEITYAAGRGAFHPRQAAGRFPWRALAERAERHRHRAPRRSIGRVSVSHVGRGDAAVRAQPGEGTRVPRHRRDRCDSRRAAGRRGTRVPAGRRPVPGLGDPNERMEKGLAKTLAYRVLASESVVSRNVAKRGSEHWGRDATAFHALARGARVGARRSWASAASSSASSTITATPPTPTTPAASTRR